MYVKVAQKPTSNNEPSKKQALCLAWAGSGLEGGVSRFPGLCLCFPFLLVTMRDNHTHINTNGIIIITVLIKEHDPSRLPSSSPRHRQE